MNRGGHNRKATGTVDQAITLDVMSLSRYGYLDSRREREWQIPGQARSLLIESQQEYGSLTIRGSLKGLAGGGHLVQDLDIEWQDCRFGGKRPWFRCNGCRKRTAKLYSVGMAFSCRSCQNLTYPTRWQRRRDRLATKIEKLERRLNLGPGDQSAGRHPLRPRLHFSTFFRLHEQMRVARAEWFASIDDDLSEWERRLGIDPDAEENLETLRTILDSFE